MDRTPRVNRALTLNEAADLLGIHRGTARRWLARGLLRGMRVGKAWRIPRIAVIALAEGRA